MGTLLAFASAVSYSLMYILVRTGVRAGDPDGGGFVTTLVNVVLLGAATLVVSVWAGPPSLEVAGLAGFAAAGFFGTFVGRILLFAAVHRVGPVRAASIANMAPLVTVGVAVVVIGESLSPAAIAAVGLLVAGLVMLIDEAQRTDHESQPDGSRDPLLWTVEAGAHDEGGVLGRRAGEMLEGMRRAVTAPAMVGLALAGGAAVAFGLSRSSRKLGIDVMPDPLFGAMTGALVALALTVLLEAMRGRVRLVLHSTIRDPRPRVWAAGVMSTVGLLTFFIAITFAPLAHVAVIAASETVVTLVLGVILLGTAERLSRRVAVPALLVFGAGVLIALS